VSIASLSINPHWLGQLTGQNPLAGTSSTSSGSDRNRTTALGAGLITSPTTNGGTLFPDIISTLQQMLPGSGTTAAGSAPRETPTPR
jgi:hypothetical protein